MPFPKIRPALLADRVPLHQSIEEWLEPARLDAEDRYESTVPEWRAAHLLDLSLADLRMALALACLDADIDDIRDALREAVAQMEPVYRQVVLDTFGPDPEICECKGCQRQATTA
jgi:hypothetical protein